jgi:cytochrome c biogenesis protein CcmG/thiol:disulfide interchange protein DsbE
MHLPLVFAIALLVQGAAVSPKPPDSDTKLVELFPDPSSRSEGSRITDLRGKPAPEIQIKSLNGKVTNLSALRGKPVFIDFWTTSCAACVALMPELKRLHAETATKGLVWISIDSDEDPDTAKKFILSKRIPWPNYHDGDGLLGKAFGREGIPLGVLIGADGKVKFYQAGYDIAELRDAIAKLAPEFSAIAPVKSR